MAQTYEDRPTLEAFNGKLGAIELIRSVTFDEASTDGNYDVDMTDFPWDEWSVVAVVSRPTINTWPVSGTCRILLLGENLGNSGMIGLNSSNLGSTGVAFFPHRDGDSQALAVNMLGCIFTYAKQSYKQIETVRYSTSDTNSLIQYPLTIRLYGIR